MFFKHRTRLTREGWYFVFILALVLVRASMKDINLMLAFAGMMAGTLYSNRFGLDDASPACDSSPAPRFGGTAGEIAVIELEATSPHRSTAIESRIHFNSGSTRREDRGRYIRRSSRKSSAGQMVNLEHRVRFGRQRFRHDSRHEPVSVSPHFADDQPAAARATCRAAAVGAAHESLDEYPAVRSRARGALQRQGLTEGDFYGMGDWRPGDSKRCNHGRAPARRGSLMVRQFEQPRSENVTLLFDLWQPAEPDHGTKTTSNWP